MKFGVMIKDPHIKEVETDLWDMGINPFEEIHTMRGHILVCIAPEKKFEELQEKYKEIPYITGLEWEANL